MVAVGNSFVIRQLCKALLYSLLKIIIVNDYCNAKVHFEADKRTKTYDMPLINVLSNVG
jgi:hypothetical protein